MASITFRVDDEVRDALQEKADEERKTLSDFVRDRLQDSVFPFRESNPSGGVEPDSLSVMDRRVLSLLHRILGRVLPDNANDVDGDKDYQLERAKVLESGFSNEYVVEFAGIEPELSIRQCEFVMDVLDMFRIALYSITALQEKGTDSDPSLKLALEFGGFDHNDPLEGQMSDYVKYLIEDDKWTEQEEFIRGREHGNSHSRMIPRYSRMLTEYRKVKQLRPRTSDRFGYLLSEEELRQIADAR